MKLPPATSLALAVALALPVLAGCLQTPTPGVAPVELIQGAFQLDLPVHIVAVGFEDFDSGALLAQLRQPVPPYKLIRAYITGQVLFEPLQYNLQYVVHDAPEAFATELFAHAQTLTTERPADSFLRGYDQGGRNRICPPADGPQVSRNLPLVGRAGTPEPACKPIQQVDGARLEQWIAQRRAEHGLDFEGAGYTIFVLDSYTKGYLPKDRYHQYAVDDGTLDPYTKNQRAWGGTHDFVFLDVGAAPNAYDYRPWVNVSRAKVTLYDQEDKPIWDYRGNAQRFYANLAQNLYDAARILWARPPIYPFEYAERYHLPFFIVVDPNAHTNPKSPLAKIRPSDIEKRTDQAAVLRAFQELLPWAEVTVDFKFIYLPEGDPGLAAAVEDSKHRWAEYVSDLGIVKKYLQANWDKYVPSIPGARVYPSFAFYLEYPSIPIFGLADYDEYGNSLGVFVNAADLVACARSLQRPVCFTEDLWENEDGWWRWWNAVLIHELGHSFGLTHTHDTGGLDDDGFSTYEINWLWDSTASPMTYRHTLYAFGQFDKDLLLRAHAVALSLEVQRSSSDASAVAGAASALALVRSGDYAAAFEAARAALRQARLDPPLEDFGRPGAAKKVTLRVPSSAFPVGDYPVFIPPPQPFVPVGIEGVNYVVLPLDIPSNARGLEIEVREQDAPTHFRQTAYAVVVNDRDQVVSFLSNNGHDKVVLLAPERCGAGCQLIFVALSGSNLVYDVTLTPRL